MAERICFLGRGGSGKSTVAQNLSHAMCRLGYKVLLVGNDVTLSSTVLLRKEMNISPALEVYRKKYEINLIEHIVSTESGVFCLELGSIDPGIGCLARGISLTDEMLDTQNVLTELNIDYVLYDISGETPCTGYILPIREGLMKKCILVTSATFASLAAANCILQAINKNNDLNVPVQMIINDTDCCEDSHDADEYARKSSTTVLARIDYCKEIAYSALAGHTVFDLDSNSISSAMFTSIAKSLAEPCQTVIPCPLSRDELLVWLKIRQTQELARRLRLEENLEESLNV